MEGQIGKVAFYKAVILRVLGKIRVPTPPPPPKPLSLSLSLSLTLTNTQSHTRTFRKIISLHYYDDADDDVICL